jgi:hypothetical protein
LGLSISHYSEYPRKLGVFCINGLAADSERPARQFLGVLPLVIKEAAGKDRITANCVAPWREVVAQIDLQSTDL